MLGNFPFVSLTPPLFPWMPPDAPLWSVLQPAIPLPTVSLSVTTLSLTEGNSGPKLFTYTVNRSDTVGAITVPWSFAAGSTSAADFTGGVLPAGGSVNIANGASSGTFSISVNGDTTLEPDETFTVSISAPSGYQAGANMSATGTITNDDITSSIALVGSAVSVSSLTGAMTVVQQIALAGTAAGVSTSAGSLSVTASGPAAMAFPAQGAAYDFDWTFLVDAVAPYRTIAPNTGSQPLSSNTNPLLYKQMTTQASHYIEDTDGSLLLRDGNMGPRRSRKGLLSYNGQWNRTVAPRDLTNAAWVKANATATLNQIGRDGAANAASLLTFTADGGTVSQAITNASILRRLFFDVKRVSGADPLEFSFDNGVTWYSITPTGTGWNRAKSSLQTLADPTIIVRGKNGNSFVLDFINLMEPREGLANTLSDLIRLTSATGVGRDRIHHTDTSNGGGPSGEQGINIVRSRYTHGLFVELCYMNTASLVATLGGLTVNVQATPSPVVLVINGEDANEQVTAPLNLDAGNFTTFNKIFYFRTPTELRLAVNGVLYRTTNVRNYSAAVSHDFATNGGGSALEGLVKRQVWFDDSRTPSDAEMIAWTS